jgi:hypothetical protein
MSEWNEEKEEPAPRDWDDLRNKALIGGGCALAVIAWMMFARPGEEASSTRGFNIGSEGGAPSGAPGRPFAARPKTSLDMVSSAIGDGPPGVTAGIYAGTMANQAAEPPPAAPAPAAASAAPPPAAPPAPAPASAADEAKELASAGIPTDAKGLANLGAKEGMLSSLAAKLLDHPKVLAAIFNNKTVVDAFMSRKRAKENCESGGALKSYLSDPNSGGMTKVFPVIQQAMSRPGTASALVSALADTEMVKRVSACPSLQALSSDTTAVTSIAMANPKALGMLMDPRGMAALASNPKAAGVLSGLQSKMGGSN